MIRVADYVMQRLYEENCKHVFLVTGRGILYLTDALARHEGLEGISVHHEQAASYAAMAYSQVNGQMGACLTSTGCGSTNAATGVLCAWQDNIPCIFISGQNSLKETVRYTKLPIRTYGQQEADIVSIVSPITKYATMITDPNDIAYEMDKAICLAKTGRKGPVWVDIPLDIQNMRVEPEELKRFVPEQQAQKTYSADDIDYVASLLDRAERPVVLVGSGVRSSGAEEQLNTFLGKYGFPVVYASSATDVVDSQKVLSIGCVGAMGANRAANFAVQNADMVLVLGCRLSSMVTGDMDKFARNAKIIAVDIDPNEHKKHPEKIDKFILCDVKEFLNVLNEKDISSVNDIWTNKCRHWKEVFIKCEDSYKQSEKVDLYHLAEILTDCLAGDAVCISDAGLEELIIPTTIEFRENQRCIHPASQGAMGYALPAAIGAYYACGKQTVAVIGDGSIMMNLQELQTISHNKLPIKILVINNNCYAVIRKRQKDLFRTRTIGTDGGNGVSCPDFRKVAECFDIRYERISSTSELNQKLESVLKADTAVICEIISKEDQGYIHSSYRKGKNGCFVQPPIEDQSPFLERDLFLSEMIIEPIDQ